MDLKSNSLSGEARMIGYRYLSILSCGKKIDDQDWELFVGNTLFVDPVP